MIFYKANRFRAFQIITICFISIFLFGCPGDVMQMRVPSFWLSVKNYNDRIDIHKFHYLIQFKDSISIDFAVDTVHYFSNPTEQTAYFKKIDVNNDFSKTIFIKGYYKDSINNLDTAIFDTLTIGYFMYEFQAYIGKNEPYVPPRAKLDKFNFNFGTISDTIYTCLNW
jgi:hypothetical protein